MIKSSILITVQILITSILFSQEEGFYIFKDSISEIYIDSNKSIKDTVLPKIVKTDKKNIINAPEDLNKNIELLKSNNSPTLKTGYSIQLLFNKDINKVKIAQSEFNAMHPDIYSYLSHKEPNFRLRVGSFRTKIEASKLLKELKKDYPGAYEVTELNIKSPQLK